LKTDSKNTKHNRFGLAYARDADKAARADVGEGCFAMHQSFDNAFDWS
jgi:hypothetical protein